MSTVHLYIDDSGTRRPDLKPGLSRNDGMDYFALGGLLITDCAIGSLIDVHKAFCEKWRLIAPLHSTKIRGRRDAFSWLGGADKVRADEFVQELEAMLLELPMMGIACVVDRPGYIARYSHAYEKPWLLCKTAYAILIERAAKFARDRKANLEIYFEQTGESEDRDILQYTRSLKEQGMPFDHARSAHYNGLQAVDFQTIILGSPQRVTKAVPMIQIADMLLYPMVKGGYDPSYSPYEKLMRAGRIIDAILPPETCSSHGVKYSCFDGKR